MQEILSKLKLITSLNGGKTELSLFDYMADSNGIERLRTLLHHKPNCPTR